MTRLIRPRETKVPFMIEGKKLLLTNLDKLYWADSGITKADMINYYIQVSPSILPCLKERPLFLQRFPDGVEGPSFYQKNLKVDQIPPWIERELIDNTAAARLICNDLPALVFLANLGCIELHVCLSQRKDMLHPDQVLFDLDPQGIGFSETVEVAFAIKSILDGAGLSSFCKTSGKKGLHILVPCHPGHDFGWCRNFALLVGSMVHRSLPAITSLERAPSRRAGKVYVDCLQNREDATVAAPYSLRPLAGAPVSTPLEWRELSSELNPSAFKLSTIPSRLRDMPDPFARFFSAKGDLGKAFEKISFGIKP